MKTLRLFVVSLTFAAAVSAFAQRPHDGGEGGGAPRGDRREEAASREAEAKAKMKEEAKAYYANADSAFYGVRYLFKYLCNKQNNLLYKEDRMVLMSPGASLDMSYEGLGESRWREANPGSKGGDTSLAYRLTPDYYFFYPATGRQVKTYRILADDFMIYDTSCDNDWKLSADETRRIGEYDCRKATLDKGGRRWTAWYTADLPLQGAPMHFDGLPGVVLNLRDDTGEVEWSFNGLVENQPESTLFIKFPDTFEKVDPDKFPLLVKIVALTDANNLQRSGVMDKHSGYYPEKYRPSTGLDAVLVDNPIFR